MQVAFKNYAPFTNCITRIDGTRIDDAVDLRFIHASLQSNRIYFKQQEVYGFIQKMKQLVLMQILLMIIILDLLNIRLNY